MKWLNPKLQDFVDENPNITIVGMYWAFLWRFFALIYGSIFIGMVLLAGLISIFE